MNKELDEKFNVLLERISERYFIKHDIPKMKSINFYTQFNTEFRIELKAELVRMIQFPENKELVKELAIVLKSKAFFLCFEDYFIAKTIEAQLKDNNIEYFVYIPTSKGKEYLKFVKRSINLK